MCKGRLKLFKSQPWTNWFSLTIARLLVSFAKQTFAVCFFFLNLRKTLKF